ncbi:hypothetical protein [Streptomyces sp. C8S0]|uniref:hypothetical protein n=1 Tax=Streptomyces sp. C8S0 TaxID=2585716 RepID=UPI00125DC51C|nr:hypothetical protein [Streptomyces sp. C8S0]
MANAITAYVSLGDTEEVLAYAEEIAGRVESSESDWSRHLVRLDVAAAHVVAPHQDIDHAMALGQDVIAAQNSRPLILSVVQRSLDLRRSVETWSARPAVRDYDEALREWTRTPQVRRLMDSATMPTPSRSLGKADGDGPAPREP